MAKPVPTALTAGERPAIASVRSSARHSRRPGREAAAKVGVLSQLHGWALVRADSPAEEAGFEPSVPA